MTRLSVNINKAATLRNARGGDNPDLIQFAKDCEKFGADGITVHPRPDERHIRKEDVFLLKEVITTELNIEGYPSTDFIDMVLRVKPKQVTLVPDSPDVLTSNSGWDTIKNYSFLKDIIFRIKEHKIRTSIFIDPIEDMIKSAKEIGTDRIELYTESYACDFQRNKEISIKPFIKSADLAHNLGLEINAGHDLNLQNLNYFKTKVRNLKEVSIGHALICDALYFGLENTIQMYKRNLN